MKKILIGVVLALVAAGTYWIVALGADTSGSTQSANEGTAIVEVELPDTLSENSEIGKTVYDAKCADCHAPNAVGQTGVAPPLVHIIYEPSHHGDESFQRAVAIGVRAHHWKFGDMAPVEGLTRGDVKTIVAYIRELQRANGIN